MPNMNDMINGMPQIMRQPKQQAGAGDMTNFLSLQMMVNRELQSTQMLHRDVSRLIKQLEDLIERNDTPGFTESVKSMIESLGDRLENPIINMDFPTDELVAVKKAIEGLKFPEGKEKVAITNLSELTRAINELKPLLMALDKDEVEGPEDVVLDKESKGYLKNLQFLDTDAKNPLAVRLSDGKEFYKGIGQLNDGIRAMTGSSGNNFLTPTGNPTKANLDANGNLLVAQSPVAVSAAVTSVAGSTSSVSLLAANSSRKGFIIYNDSTAILYVKLGATASTSSFTYRLTPNGIITESAFGYTGAIDGIWVSATGNARITELS